jgi:maltose alpha-D-glucosyltransferase/alpha-amylase
VAPADTWGLYNALARTLGERTAEMHAALSTPTGNPDFEPEPVTAADREGWRDQALRQADRAFQSLRLARPTLSPEIGEEVDRLLAREAAVAERITRLASGPITAAKVRIHGDFHLGQVLRSSTDWAIIDFEGEPAKTLAQRRARNMPLRDVAGMLRSFDYCSWAALRHIADVHADAVPRLRPLAEEWEAEARRSFLDGYLSRIGDSPSHPREPAELSRLLSLFELEKALYEIVYEAGNRPSWLPIPIRGVMEVMDSQIPAP